ncbi:MAG: leucine-rich repeat protein, partial [Bacillota bacterium]|nr:leucine-rich repeat protein [Bacillota bacterium]
ITIPSTVTEIGNSAFQDCNQLTDVKFPEGLKTIGNDVFQGDTVLETIELPDSVETIGRSAFYKCNELKNITFSNNLKTIGRDAFNGCKQIKEITLPSGIETIQARAFEECDGLTEITIPKSLTNVGGGDYFDTGIFNNCKNLKTIKFEKGITKIPNNLLRETDIEKITIPSTVTEIGNSAFQDCHMLKQAVVSDTVSVVGDNAFANCENLTITCNSGTAIYEYAKQHNIKYLVLAEHKHEYTNWTRVKEPTCTEKGLETSDDCFCGIVGKKEIPALDHDFSDEWTVDKQATCTKDGQKSRHCTRCDEITDIQKISALGHDYEKNWTVDIDSTCTKDGQESRHCTRCDSTTDKRTKKSTGHVYGDWVTVEQATSVLEGKQEKKCIYCDDTRYKIVPKLETNSELPKGYGTVKVQVIDSMTAKTVDNASVNFVLDEKESYTVNTDESGFGNISIPAGKYKITVMKNGYGSRTIEKTIEEGNQTIDPIAIATSSIITSDFVMRELDLAEMKQAGIDVDDIRNQHVFKYEFTLKFIEGIEDYELPIDIFKNGEGDVLGYNFGNSTNTCEKEGTFSFDFKGIPFYVNMNEFLCLVVKGESKWTKEMFEVTMIAFNHSVVEDMKDCKATILTPRGLSFPKMIGAQQDITQDLGLIEKESVGAAKWYVKGDLEGDYNIEVLFNGKYATHGDSFTQRFKSKNSLHVYSGSALKMTIGVENAAYHYKETENPYEFYIEIENVSDRKIYNLTNTIKSVEQFKVKDSKMFIDPTDYRDPKVWESLGSGVTFGDDGTAKATVFSPGEKIVLKVQTDILWESPLLRLKNNKLVKLAMQYAGESKIPAGMELNYFYKLISCIDVRYYLSDMMVLTLEGSTTTIPTEFNVIEKPGVNIFEKLWNLLKGKFEDKLKDEFKGELKSINADLEVLIELKDIEDFEKWMIDKGLEYTPLYKKLHENIEMKKGKITSEGVEIVEEGDDSFTIGTKKDKDVPGYVVAVQDENNPVIQVEKKENGKSKLGRSKMLSARKSQSGIIDFVDTVDLKITALRPGNATIYVIYDDGHVYSRKYEVKEAGPGNSKTYMDYDNILDSDYIPLTEPKKVTKSYLNYLDLLGVKVVDRDSNPLEENSYITTGAKLIDSNSNSELQFVVKGDVNGDLERNIFDGCIINDSLHNKITLTDLQKEAANVTMNKTLSNDDTKAIFDYIMKSRNTNVIKNSKQTSTLKVSLKDLGLDQLKINGLQIDINNSNVVNVQSLLKNCDYNKANSINDDLWRMLSYDYDGYLDDNSDVLSIDYTEDLNGEIVLDLLVSTDSEQITKTVKFKVGKENGIVSKSVSSIKISKLPNQVSYLEGKDELNLSGGELTVYYDDKTHEDISLDKAKVKGFDNTKVGKQNLIVEYSGKTTSFEVEVKEKEVSSIEISQLPTKIYFIDNKITIKDGVATIKYNNGTEEKMNLNLLSVIGTNDFSKDHIITLAYKGKTVQFKWDGSLDTVVENDSTNSDKKDNNEIVSKNDNNNKNKATNSKTKNIIDTGDNTSIVAYILIIILSGIVLIRKMIKRILES